MAILLFRPGGGTELKMMQIGEWIREKIARVAIPMKKPYLSLTLFTTKGPTSMPTLHVILKRA
jgi:hypothetical protein